MKNKRTASIVWKYFTAIDKEKGAAKCNTCGHVLMYKSTITNLKKHLVKLHPTLFSSDNTTKNEDNNDVDHADCSSPNSLPVVSNEHQDIVIPVTSTIEASTITTHSTEEPMYIVISEPSNNIDNLLLQMIIQDYYPISIVEDDSFLNFVNGLNPSYKLPTREVIKNSLIPAEYNKCQAALHHELTTVNSVCLSIETWMSVNLENYIGVTAHYITESFELRSVFLECLLMPMLSTDLAELIRITIDKFNLLGKVSMVLSNNFSYIKDAITKELQKEHFTCFAYTLNIILQDALKTEKELLDKIKCIIKYFKRNSYNLEKLNSNQISFGLEPKILLEEIPTRWNSIFYMIQCFTELREAIKKTINGMNKELPVLTDDDWETCKELCVVLKPFEEVTEEMCDEHYLAGSLIIPLTNGLKNVCEKIQEGEFGPITKRVIARILKGINAQMFQIEENKSFALATFLDPRFKLAMFSNESSAQSIKMHCINLMTDTWNQQEEGKSSLEEADHVNNQSDTSTSSVGRLVKYSVWENLDKKIASKKSRGSMSAAMIEINTYIEDTFLGRKEDPLLWWKNNQYYYPLMTKLVKTKFNIMGSSLPCKNLFTKAGNLKADRRSRLKAKHMEKLLFLNANSFLIH